jgi:hypothetical protein
VVETDTSTVQVHGVERPIVVKVASTAAEWEAAFRLVREKYLESGYEAPSTKLLRFTPYHALPDTAVIVAKAGDEVVATFTLVPDTIPLGLPLEGLYEEEVEALRRQGRRLAEVTSLAAANLSQREFVHVFATMMRVMMQYHLRHGGDTWVITVNPRHRNFYCRTYGYAPLGPRRAYEAVQGHPAEAFWVDRHLMQSGAPKQYEEIYERPLPPEVLQATQMPIELIRYLASESSQFDALDVDQILGYVERNGNPRRW